MIKRIIVPILLASLATLGVFSLARTSKPEFAASQWAGISSAQVGYPTSFTYQGQLMDRGSRVDGLIDFNFSLYDSASIGTGNLIGMVVINDHPVKDGLFTVELDFGDVFDGTAMWLEIAVRPGDSTDPHTILEPRQALSGTPYAHFATRAESTSWPGLTNVPAGFADNLDNDTLGALGCVNGQIAEWNGSNWICGTDDTGGAGAAWLLNGNSGTVPGTNFLGTFDNQPLELRVNNARVLLLQPRESSPNIIGGYSGNMVGATVAGATISGGGFDLAINQINANFGVIGGGSDNTINGYAASIGGGESNTVGGSYAVISGGSGNSGGGDAVVVGGGTSNSATARNATVSGGLGNQANGAFSTVGGGASNTVTDPYGSASGGINNVAGGTAAAIGGGDTNLTYSGYATIGGGQNNLVTATYGTIAGGGPADPANPATTNNRVNDEYGTIGGGGGNIAGSSGDTTDQLFTTIGGGANNFANASYGTISGGQNNTVTGYAAEVSGGQGNTAAGSYASLGGGSDNLASANYATIAGGRSNSVSVPYSTIGGGFSNNVNASLSAILGGFANTATGNYSTVGGGATNSLSGDYSMIPGGLENNVGGDYGFAAGFRANAAHQGSFVWSDSTEGITTTGSNQFLIDADGGVGIGTNAPDATLAVDGSVRLMNGGELILRGVYSNTGTMESPSALFSAGPYLYVTSQATNTLSILDVSDPANPTPIGITTSGLGGPNDVQVIGKRAYVTNFGLGTLQVFDISDPTAPVSLGSWSFNIRSAEAVYISGKYAYVASAGSISTGIYDGLAILDISDPSDILPKAFTETNLDGTSDVYVSGNYAFVASKKNNRLVIFDVTDPDNVIPLDYATDSLVAPTEVYVNGKYAYVLGESSNNLVVFDISDPNNILFTGQASTSLTQPKDLFVSGEYAYLAFGGDPITGINSGLAVIDIADPTDMQALSVIDMSSSLPIPERPVAIHGNGKQIFVANNSHDSVAVYDLEHLTAASVETGNLLAEHLEIEENAVIDNDVYVRGGLNVGGGGLLVDGELSIAGNNNNYILGPVSLGGVQGTFTDTSTISETYTVYYPSHQVDVQGEARFRVNHFNNLLISNPGIDSGDAAIDFIGNEYGTVVTPTARIIFNAVDPITSTTGIEFYTQGPDDATMNARVVIAGDGDVYPAETNQYALGTPDNRWTWVYTINGVSQTSDRRLKDSIAPIPYGLAAINALQPVAYNWRGTSSEEVHFGLLAQDVSEVIPEVVHTGPDPERTLSIHYTEIVPVLIQAVQEQQVEIDQQASQIEALEARLAALESDRSSVFAPGMNWIGLVGLLIGAVILVKRKD